MWLKEVTLAGGRTDGHMRWKGSRPPREGGTAQSTGEGQAWTKIMMRAVDGSLGHALRFVCLGILT